MFLTKVSRMVWAGAAALGLLLAWVTAVQCGEGRVFSKRRDLPLLESANPEAKAVATAEWNEELAVSESSGRWLKVSAKSGEGWVYAGNVSKEKLPQENKNDIGIKADRGMTEAAAGRSLSGGAQAYATRHNCGNVAEQVKWVEKISAGIKRDAAVAYLKAQKLGEYSEKK